jgi:hypothetical protein
VTVNPTAQANDTLWVPCLARELGDRITLGDLPSQYAATALDFFIEKVSITVTADGGTPTWSFVFGLSPASVMPNVLELDDAVFGLLDSGNVLGY